MGNGLPFDFPANDRPKRGAGMWMEDGTHHVGSCLAMMPLGELGLVAVPRLEVGGQSTLNCLRRHFCCVIWRVGCREGGGMKTELRMKFGPDQRQATKFEFRCTGTFKLVRETSLVMTSVKQEGAV